MRLFPFLFLILVLVCEGGQLPEAQAFQAGRVQHGKVNLDLTALTADFNLPQPVDPGKSFLTLSMKVNSFDASEASLLVAAYFLDRHTLRVIRQKSGSAVEVFISVTEFKNGVKVTHGVTQFSTDVYQKRIVVAKLQNKSAVSLLMATAPDFVSDDGAHLLFTSIFSDSSTLSIKRAEGAEIKSEKDEEIDVDGKGAGKKKDVKTKIVPRFPIPEATVYWQIIEFFDGVKISQGSAKLPHFVKDTNAYLVEPVQFSDRAFILFNWIAGQMTHGKKRLSTLQAALSDKSVLLFSRPAKGEMRLEDLEVQWSVLELESAASLVQNGTVKFGANEPEKVIPLKSVYPGRALVLLTTSGGDSGQTIPEIQQSASLKFAGEMISSDELRVSRGEGESSVLPAEVNWSVVQFAPLSLREPRGGQLWFIGEKREILWDYSLDMLRDGNGPKGVQQVDISLSLNPDIDSYPYVLAAQIPIDAGRYEWMIPEEIDDQSLIGKHIKVKVQISGRYENYFDVSKKDFEIKGNLKILAPQGGEVWYVGEEFHEIKWEYKGQIGILSLYYDTESGYGTNPFPKNQRIARVVPGKKGRGSFLWTPLPDISSTRVRIKIISEADKEVSSVSEKDFAVIPLLRILSPRKNADIFDAEKYQMIKWESAGTIDALNLYFRTSETGDWILSAKNIAGGKAGLKSYRWFVPPEAVSETLQLKLEKAGDPYVSDWAPGNGNGFFAARSWIEFKSPSQTAVTWRIGEKREIEWDYGGLTQYLNFEYSADGGKTWLKEAVIKSGDKKFVWLIPDAVSDQVKIRLSDVNHAETFCESKRNIRILMASDFAATNDSTNSAWWLMSEKRRQLDG